MVSPYLRQIIKKSSSGTTVGTITIIKANEYLFPLPPLSEQHRIVSKIEELLPLISEYEKAETQLTALNTTFPDRLKKSILQQAIQGKLVPQDPNDEPASVLLERIKSEKQELIKAGKIKKDKNESVIYKRDNSHYELCGGVERCIDDEIPFEVPETWAWCRLNNCCIDIADIDHKMPEQVENGIPYISPLNFTDNNGIDYDRAKKISYTDYEKLAVKCTPECNDIIFPRYGTIGVLRYITTNRKFLVSYSCATIKPSKTYSLPIYIYYVLHSPWIQNNEIMRYINKTTQPNIGLQSIKNFLIPFPPLSEQKRIVSKIEELIPLIQTL